MLQTDQLQFSVSSIIQVSVLSSVILCVVDAKCNLSIEVEFIFFVYFSAGEHQLSKGSKYVSRLDLIVQSNGWIPSLQFLATQILLVHRLCIHGLGTVIRLPH